MATVIEVKSFLYAGFFLNWNSDISSFLAILTAKLKLYFTFLTFMSPSSVTATLPRSFRFDSVSADSMIVNWNRFKFIRFGFSIMKESRVRYFDKIPDSGPSSDSCSDWQRTVPLILQSKSRKTGRNRKYP